MEQILTGVAIILEIVIIVLLIVIMASDMKKTIFMSDKKDFQTQNEATRKLLNDSQEVSFPYYLEYLGLKVRVDKGVFSPKHFEGWRIFNKYFPVFIGKTVLELGTGTGVTSLYLASEGAKKVVAVDISREAVENCSKNITLNKINNMKVRYSDLFSGIKPEEKFDIIYWNMPFGYVEDNFVHQNTLEKSIFDPGYNILRSFLKEAPKFLAYNGYVLIGTGSGANLKKFQEIVVSCGYSLELLAKKDAQEVFTVDFQLYKLIKKTE